MRRPFFLAVLWLLGTHPTSAAPDRQDVTTLSAHEVAALQARLKDDGCYSGAIDGVPSDATKAAVQSCPDQRPQLRIETGMHVASVWRIAVDRDCTVAATGSDDGTVRLWSLPGGEARRTLRWPVGRGSEGHVYATAMSPDGHFVAAGGWDAGMDEATGSNSSTTIFDAGTGAIVARIGVFETVIKHLAFSQDGRWLAVLLGANYGVRIIETSRWQVIAEDRNYGEDSYGAVFAPDGRFYTASFDGRVRRYAPGPGFEKEAEIVTRGGRRAFAIDVDPSNELVAVGFDDRPAIDIYDTRTMRLRHRADTTGVVSDFIGTVAWSSDGRTLIGGSAVRQTGLSEAFTFGRDGRRTGGPISLGTNLTRGIQRCGAGFAFATNEPAFGLLDSSGRKSFWKTPVTFESRRKTEDAFTVSADARRVRFGLEFGAEQPVLFDLAKGTLTDSSQAPSGLLTPVVKNPGLGWRNSEPFVLGRPLELMQFELVRSLAARPNADGFVLGTAFRVRAYETSGRERWTKSLPGPAWGINLSGDGRVVIACIGDGTIRWYRWSDGQELLALFVNKQNRTWVAWTPSGYYMAAPGGEDMIGWQVNRGWAQAADFFPASKFRDQFSRPDVVETILDTLDEAAAVKQADAARGGRSVPTRPLLERLPPVIDILSPAPGANVGDDVQVDYLVRSPSNLPVDAVETLVDGRPVSASRGLTRVSKSDALAQCLAETRGLGRPDGALQGCRSSVTVHLQAGAREIGLFARSGDRTSEVVRIQVARELAARGAGPVEAPKPKLYALVVGISAYANADYALTYPAKDARDFASSLANQKGGQYGDVEVRTLTDGQATERAIKSGLDWLTKQVTAHDVGLVYLAGHGMLDDRERFYFLAADSDAGQLRATAVPRDDIADALDALPGKALLFLDACHAGAVALGRKASTDAGAAKPGTLNVNAVVNDLADAEHGVTVFAASTGRQLSQENAAWNNGAFTKAVVEGLGLPGNKAKADLVGTGAITTSELDAYVSNRVKMLTGGEQSPVMIRPATVPDFSLAMAR